MSSNPRLIATEIPSVEVELLHASANSLLEVKEAAHQCAVAKLVTNSGDDSLLEVACSRTRLYVYPSGGLNTVDHMPVTPLDFTCIEHPHSRNVALRAAIVYHGDDALVER